MRAKHLLLWAAALLCTANVAMAQVTTPQYASPKAKVTQYLGLTEITITYSRPSTRDREIWGGLVHYDMANLGFGTAKESPWRAGANENTVFTVSHDVEVEGKALAAGTYGLFIAVHENGEATVIFSENSSSWGSYFYNPEEDALRVKIKTTDAPSTEQLTFSFPEVGTDYTVAALTWEKKTFPFRISAKVHDQVLANARNQLRSTTGFNHVGPLSAATYCLQNQINMEEGLQWAQQAVAMQPSYNTLSTQGALQMQLGKKEDALATMEKAMEFANVGQLHQMGRQLITMGEKEMALKVFETNMKKNPGVWPVNYGMARGLSANGEYKKALKYLKKAQANLPEGDTVNGKAIAANIEKLEKGEDIN